MPETNKLSKPLTGMRVLCQKWKTKQHNFTTQFTWLDKTDPCLIHVLPETKKTIKTADWNDRLVSKNTKHIYKLNLNTQFS